PIGEHEAAIAAVLRHAIGEGEGERHAGRESFTEGALISPFPSPSCPPKPAFGRRRMRGGVRGGGNHARSSLLRPPSPTLPRKGGGSGETGRAARSIIARNLRSPAPCHVASAGCALRAVAADLV